MSYLYCYAYNYSKHIDMYCKQNLIIVKGDSGKKNRSEKSNSERAKTTPTE